MKYFYISCQLWRDIHADIYRSNSSSQNIHFFKAQIENQNHIISIWTFTKISHLMFFFSERKNLWQIRIKTNENKIHCTYFNEICNRSFIQYCKLDIIMVNSSHGTVKIWLMMYLFENVNDVFSTTKKYNKWLKSHKDWLPIHVFCVILSDFLKIFTFFYYKDCCKKKSICI